MSHRLVAVAICAAVAACSAPSEKSCAQSTDCDGGQVCNAGVCQHAADLAITSGPSGPVNVTTATFTFASATAGATFECKLDTEAGFAACTSPKSYSAVAEGSRTFLVRARVGANVTAPASRSWVVDVTGPVVNLVSTPASTQSANPTFVFSSPEGTATFQCSVDSGAWGACTSPKAYVVPGDLSAGPHTFYVRGVDALGNLTSPPASYQWNQAPETSITCGPLAVTNRTTETVVFGSNVGSATFECQLDSGGYSACTSPRAFGSLSAASHTVSVRAVAGGVIDPTPASTTFTVSPSSALLFYNLEGSGVNTGVLSPATGYTATLGGSTPPTYVSGFVFSHGGSGDTGLSFNATSTSSTGSVTIPGTRQLLSHDCDPTDAKYTIAVWYQEPSSPNLAAAYFTPSLFNTRPGATGGGFVVYHGSIGPTWTTCFDTTPSAGGCFTTAATTVNTPHRFSIEYSYNTTTTGYDLKTYFDGALVGTTTTGAGQTIFNTHQQDLVVGGDWRGYMDALRIYNTTMGGTAP